MDTVNITLALPKGLYDEMKKYEEIRWSTVIKSIINKKIRDLELLDKLTARSKLTEKDVEELSELIKQSAAKKLNIY
jgi:predicted CopG family antitoxin